MTEYEVKDRILLFLIIFIGIHALVSHIKIFYKKTERTRKLSQRHLGFEDMYDDSIYRERKIRSQLMFVGMEIMLLAYSISSIYMIEDKSDNADISIRIENISQELEVSSAELVNIQKELEERIKFVEELKKEAEIAENVISLTDEQVNAVQEKLNEELEASSNQGLVQNIIISTIFFGLGLIIQPIINLIKQKFSKENENSSEETALEKYSSEEIEQAIKFLDAFSQSMAKSTKEE